MPFQQTAIQHEIYSDRKCVYKGDQDSGSHFPCEARAKIRHGQSDACERQAQRQPALQGQPFSKRQINRSEEHTSELQSRENLVCRLLLEKKKQKVTIHK